MNRIAALCLFLVSLTLSGQNFEDSWTGHFSYISVKDISYGNDRIYAGAENAVFTYDLSTNEINTISTIQGLSGERITQVYYSENFDLLVIGYENGLMEIVIDGDEDVLQVVDILEKPSIPPNMKRINHFHEYNGNLYISTDFGISVYDLSALEFGDSFFIGDAGQQMNVRQTTILEPHIYAATENGMRRADVDNPDLIDFAEWTTIVNGDFKAVQTLGDEVIISRSNNFIISYSPSAGVDNIESFPGDIVDFGVQGNILTIATNTFVRAYTEGYVQTAAATSISGFESNFLSVYALNNNFYIGTEEEGMLIVPFASNQGQQVLPDGPIRNDPFALDASPGQLWVSFGDLTQTFNPFPLDRRGISNLRVDEGWTNIPFDEIGFDATNIAHVKINPENFEETYMSSFQKGLLRINGQDPEILFDQSNSPLEQIFVPPNNADAGVRILGADFDRDGNLWFVQSRTNNGLIRLSPGGQFSLIDISNIINGANELALTDLAVSREGFVFFGTAQSGMIGYNPQQQTFQRITEGIGQGNLTSVNVRALALDANNRLWIGLTDGLRVLFNVSGFFDEGANIDAQEIVFLDDGVPQELLFGQSVTDIEIDGSNNKWLATSDSGVFLVNPTGQETLQRFTADNSPLPSNNVQDMAIDDVTGTVYFATTNGLVAFRGTSTAPRDDLSEVYSFPNPVRPGFMGNVTIDGLTARANVKITDIEGNLVFETTSRGGSVLWDTTAFGRYKVRTGVYLVLITTEDAIETTVHKIMIVR